MEKKQLGILPDGRNAMLYTFSNDNGMEMTVSDLGAVLVSLSVPDKDGVKRDVVLGYDNLDAYLNNTNTYLGATVGRSANRIAGACFEINGKEYQMTKNEGNNNLHSGPDGYQIRLWETQELLAEKNGITFILESPAMDQGFPGRLIMKTTYLLTKNNEVKIIYEGISDEDTVFNPTNHSYFNLNGHTGGTVLEHVLKLNAQYYTPVSDSTAIPTGEIAQVEGTPMNFRTGKTIGADIEAEFEQLLFTGGFDHNYVLDKKTEELGFAAEVKSNESGIWMKVYTDLPGIQFYAGNFIKNEKGKNKAVYEKRNGFCLETQYFPNSINTKEFASPILKAGKEGRVETIYQFGC